MSKAPRAKTKTTTGRKKKPAKTKAPVSKMKTAQAPAQAPERPPETEKAAPEATLTAPEPTERDIEPPPALPPEPGAKPSGGGMGAFVVLVVLAGLGIGGYASWPYWSSAVAPYLSSPPAAPAAPKPVAQKTPEILNEQLAAERRQLRAALDRLMIRMENIEKAVENVKKLAQATTPPSEKMADDAALKSLAGRLDEIEENGATMKTLLNRMDRMEESAAAEAEARAKEPGPRVAAGGPRDATALVLVVANLRQVLTTGEPYVTALDALKALAGDNPVIGAAVALLVKNSTTGIATLPDLNRQFAAIAGKIVQASRATGKSGWLNRVGNRLSSLVTWRRIDGKGQDAPIDALVAAAETDLTAGNLKAAVAAVAGISVNAEAAAVAAPWLAAAKARLAADRAASSLYIHAISQLTPIKSVQG